MLKIIKHINIDQSTLLEIVKIKQLSWNYSMDEHLIWIKNNIRDNDYHFMLYSGSEVIAYINLIEVAINSNSVAIPFLGIGNVCTKYKGRGDGKKLMMALNNFLHNNSFHGILFCKEELVDFYNKFDWKAIKNLYPQPHIYTMIYNFTEDTSDFIYTDRLF